MYALSWAATALLALTVFSCCTWAIQGVALFRVRRRPIPAPDSYPAISVLKPMAGYDDDLVENLESHLALDYPGEYELVLGVRDENDSAYPVAKAFAEKYAHRGVRLVLQEGEPGFNPKVNQLITLTRHAKHEVIALTDANVRVPKHWLRENAAALAQPGIGLSTNIFAGAEEESIGAAFDHMTLASFCAASMATAEAWGLNLIVGKSLALSKTTLAKIGGWEEVKDLLAEDQRLGFRLKQAQLRTRACPTFVENVQRKRTVAQFWDRYSRWAMLRFRVIPGFWLEPLLIPTIWALGFLLFEPSLLGLGVFALASAWNAVFTDVCSRWTRGRGMALKYVLLTPVRDVLMFASWVRGTTLRTVNWRGNVLRVGKNTLLSREGVSLDTPVPAAPEAARQQSSPAIS
ncbi:MAG: glycosyltransferase [Myxococcaceae bacterium]|nr:glycosyltransferase [Myxococcaceae bacterium]